MKETDLASYNNDWYRPANKFKVALWYFFNFLFFNTQIPFPGTIKIFLLRAFGAKVGRNIIIKPKVSIKFPWLLQIGSNVWIGENVWIDNLAKVTIESNVCISQGVMLLCGNHNYKKSTFDLILGEISLEKGVWIGAQAVVCPDVTCGNHSVLTVGSVATKDLEAYTIYQGNPAIKVKGRLIE